LAKIYTAFLKITVSILCCGAYLTGTIALKLTVHALQPHWLRDKLLKL